MKNYSSYNSHNDAKYVCIYLFFVEKLFLKDIFSYIFIQYKESNLNIHSNRDLLTTDTTLYP